jgi:hypothetical protein
MEVRELMTMTADEEVSKENLEHLLGVNHTKDVRLLRKDRDKDKESKPSIMTYKYSNNRKGLLHESVILAGHPVFIKYENGQVKAVEHIEEPTRIIRPHRKEEYPYPPLGFADINEVKKYVNKAKIMNIEALYLKAKDIVLKYVDQEEPIIIMIVADIIWTYYQDLFATTHYADVTGNNETGKSTIGHVFQYTGYRVVKATGISAANYYRTLGTVEPGQCTIIEDEADYMEEDKDKIKIYKAGYEYDARIPKVNMNTKEQNQNWYYPYCYKMRIGEKALDPFKAKGLKERIFGYECRSATKDNLYSIKEVTTNSPGDTQKQELYGELIDFRKEMLCYRLIHYMDSIQNIDTGLKGRDKELGGPLLQIFYGTKAFGDIKYALQKFLAKRKDDGRRKQKTVESALGPLIVKLIEKNNTLKLPVGLIWNEAINTIPGRLNPQKPNEYQTNEYGTIYMNTFSKKIVDTFGAVRDKKNSGIMLVFDEEKINELKRMHKCEVQDQDKAKAKDAAPNVFNEPTKIEDNNVLEDDSEGSESSEGYRICGYIIEEQ